MLSLSLTHFFFCPFPFSLLVVMCSHCLNEEVNQDGFSILYPVYLKVLCLILFTNAVSLSLSVVVVIMVAVFEREKEREK